MSQDLERRLTEAYRARADLVTEGSLRTLTPLDLPGSLDETRGQPRPAQLRRAARWGLPLLAAACVALIVIATIGFGHPAARPQPFSPPTPTVVLTPTATPTKASPSPRLSAHPSSSRPSKNAAGPVALAAGQVGTRAEIPWSLVGDGWSVALWAPTQDAIESVYLVDPAGGRYEVATLPSPGRTFVVDVSGDRRRTLLEGQLDPQRVYDVDLTSGQVRPLDFPIGTAGVEYAGPTSTGYIVVVGSTVQLVSFAGKPERTYPARAVGLSGVLPLVSPDGTRLVFDDDRALLVTDQHGGVVATLPVAGGVRDCTAVRWWQPGVVLTRCSEMASERLWLVSLGGAGPTPVDALAAPGAPGDGDAWTIQGQVFVGELPSCGSATRIGRLDGSGRPVWLPLPPVGPYGVMMLTGATTDTIYGVVNVGCGTSGQTALIRYDPVSETSVTLLGSALGGGYVSSAVTFGVDERGATTR